MITAYKKFWQNYTNFTGRSSRADYWWVYLCQVLITLPLTLVLMGSLFGAFASVATLSESGMVSDEYVTSQLLAAVFSPGNIFVWALLAIYGLASFIPNIALTVRRLRDAGFHWALIFVSFIPYVGGLILLVLLLMPTKTSLVVSDATDNVMEP